MLPTADMHDAVEAVSRSAKLLELEALVGGSSASVFRLELALPAGGTRSVVFRQHSDRVGKGHDNDVAVKEFWLLRALVELDFAVPQPLAVCGDNPVGGSWLALDFVAGSADVAAETLEDALLEMAKFLARLHRAPIDVAGIPGLTHLEDPIKALPDYLPADGLGPGLAGALEAGFDRQPNADVVLHGDYWPGNVLFRDGRIVAVIDWEDASLGDPLVDLACARVELLCAFGPAAMEAFSRHYLRLAAPLDLTDLPLWEAYVSATALTSMHTWGLSTADESDRRATTRAFFDRATSAMLER